MNRSLRFAETARQQLRDAFEHIAVEDPRAARSLLASIQEKLELVTRFPQMGRAVPELSDARREVVVGSFRVVYLPSETRIDVLAVVHGRQHLPDHVDEDD